MFEGTIQHLEMPWPTEGFEVVDDRLDVIGPDGEFMSIYKHDLELLDWADPTRQDAV